MPMAMLYSTMSQTITMKMIFSQHSQHFHISRECRVFGSGEEAELRCLDRREWGNMGALRSTLSFGLLTAFVGFTVSAFESNIFDTVSEW